MMLTLSFHNTGQLEIGFRELEQTELEGNTWIKIWIDKSGTNVGNLEVRVMAIKYDQLEGDLPEELVMRGLPDPAECKLCLTGYVVYYLHDYCCFYPCS